MRTVCLILLTALGSGLRSQASLHTENGTVNLTSPGQDEASWSEDYAAVTSAHTVNDRARNIR